MVTWLLAAFHLLALGLGLGAVWARAGALRAAPDPAAVRRALRADNAWGVAALLWLGTGLARWLLGTEKPAEYYAANHVFWLKMLLFVAIVGIEIAPAIDLVRWRRAIAKGASPDTARAPRWATASRVEAVLVVLAMFAAAAMARGFGAR